MLVSTHKLMEFSEMFKNVENERYELFENVENQTYDTWQLTHTLNTKLSPLLLRTATCMPIVHCMAFTRI